ncbi:hypothetical protein NEMBOFW57_000141 [Staphylotrichum longicolle]|uniref:Uncharacterized protein n=1 Tax=Staphylotrichum longicolle TaxID=669026 RepID=A0AAD4EZ33_9PEZI|nr:hypothetical protein NEMBOFW57_000141 [Staphylotrichum longicolle]
MSFKNRPSTPETMSSTDDEYEEKNQSASYSLDPHPSPFTNPSTFADRHPHTTVTGTDVSPIQPTWVPTNLTFHMEDATQPAWSYPSSRFGFVHMRYLAGSVASWTALLREAHRCCAPGGWAESLEVSCVFRSEDGSGGVGEEV